MIKRAYAVQLSYQVTDEEKSSAEKALLVLNATKSLLNKSSDYLNVIYNPFSKNPSIESDQIFNYRTTLRKFRDNAIDNFNEFKVGSFKCISILNNFSTDTQTMKLIKSFTNSVEELESKVNNLVDLFDDLKSKDFVADVIKNVESIQKKCDEIDALIDERIKTHIKNNILSKSWVDNIGDDLQMKIERKTPLIIDLYSERKKELEKSFNNGEEHAS